jgi:hypothetical protein
MAANPALTWVSSCSGEPVSLLTSGPSIHKAASPWLSDQTRPASGSIGPGGAAPSRWQSATTSQSTRNDSSAAAVPSGSLSGWASSGRNIRWKYAGSPVANRT